MPSRTRTDVVVGLMSYGYVAASQSETASTSEIRVFPLHRFEINDIAYIVIIPIWTLSVRSHDLPKALGQ
jgi:hypothetical protein